MTLIFMMVITMVFVLKVTKFWKMERKKLSLFGAPSPLKHCILYRGRAERARGKKIWPFLMALDGGKTGRFLIENLVIFMIIS